MKTLKEEYERQSGPGVGRIEDADPKYLEYVEKGYFNPTTRKWDPEKMRIDGVLKGTEEPQPVEPTKPEEPKVPTEKPVRAPIETPPATPPATPQETPETPETKELKEQVLRMKKLMGL